MDGFYVAYLTGRGGNSALLFAIKSNKLIGVDVGGMNYDGRVIQSADGNLKFNIQYVVKPGTSLITGVGSVATATPVALDFTAPSNFSEGAIITVNTPFGPVNAKILKLREFDF